MVYASSNKALKMKKCQLARLVILVLMNVTNSRYVYNISAKCPLVKYPLRQNSVSQMSSHILTSQTRLNLNINNKVLPESSFFRSRCFCLIVY